jgi:hypothetical protein
VRPKALVVILLAIFILLPHRASGGTKADFIILKERTWDGYLLTIYRGNSVDYRSDVHIEFADSLADQLTGAKIQVEVIRESQRRFKVPAPVYTEENDSGAVAFDSWDFDPRGDTPLRKTRIDLHRWALEPGDELHIKVYDRIDYSYFFERYIPVKTHGFSADFSFPILSVQRAGDHPGGLGAGISCAIRHVRPEKSLLNKVGFGLNASFLDFTPDQTIEIGLGLVITFPDDLFQIGVGKNLAVNRDSGYYFLGINLQAVKEKIDL